MDRIASLTASRETFAERYDDFIGLIRTLDSATVLWRPPAPDANTIAALVRHIAGANDMWLRRAVGDQVTRDRDAEFRYEDTPAGLIALLEQSRAATEAVLERLAGVDPGVVRHVVFASTGREADVTVAWCIEHALVHMSEHWGHAQLTAQLAPRP